MELRHLRYFTAVVQWKGYREAARHLYGAEPSTSQAVSDLELLRDVFGAGKLSVRVVPGVASIPLGMPVELEVILEAGK